MIVVDAREAQQNQAHVSLLRSAHDIPLLIMPGAFSQGIPYAISLTTCAFLVAHDEISHRGQAALLRERIATALTCYERVVLLVRPPPPSLYPTLPHLVPLATAEKTLATLSLTQDVYVINVADDAQAAATLAMMTREVASASATSTATSTTSTSSSSTSSAATAAAAIRLPLVFGHGKFVREVQLLSSVPGISFPTAATVLQRSNYCLRNAIANIIHVATNPTLSPPVASPGAADGGGEGMSGEQLGPNDVSWLGISGKRARLASIFFRRDFCAGVSATADRGPGKPSSTTTAAVAGTSTSTATASLSSVSSHAQGKVRSLNKKEAK